MIVPFTPTEASDLRGMLGDTIDYALDVGDDVLLVAGTFMEDAMPKLGRAPLTDREAAAIFMDCSARAMMERSGFELADDICERIGRVHPCVYA